jgi:hypothetical protein
MAHRRYTIDDKRTARFEKEGRGQGAGEDYKSWLKIQDVPSRGRSHRLVGMTTGRLYHFMSDLERDLFLLLDWQESVVDLREQVPLDRNETARIAEALGIRHPKTPGASEPMVMTTDLVIDRRGENGIETEEFAVKTAEDLEKPRTLHRLEIERRYWLDQGISWSIVTRAELPRQTIANIAWVHGCYRLEGLSDAATAVIPQLLLEIGRHANLTLRPFCAVMDRQFGLADGEALALIRHLIATRTLRCDMATITLNDRLSLTALSITTTLDRRESA